MPCGPWVLHLMFEPKLFLLSEEGLGLQGFEFRGRQVIAAFVFVSLAQEACGADRAVKDGVADLGGYDLDHGADEWAGRVVFTAVAPRVAHAADAGFVKLRQFAALGLGVEGEAVHHLQHVAEDVARAERVAQFGEDFADLVVDGLGACGGSAERPEVGEQLLVHEGDQVFANQRLVMFKRAVDLRRSPKVRTEGAVYDGRVGLTVEFRAVAAFSFKIVQVFEELDPRNLFHVIQFVRDAVFVSKFAFDAVEGVFVY